MALNNSQLNLDEVRQDFPILSQTVHDKPLVYLDNAATTQKPLQVIHAIDEYYCTTNANVHRGVHFLSEKATEQYELARQVMAEFVMADDAKECIFTRGTTEAINLVANSFVLPMLQAGDEVLITHLEHHSNIVPWQMVCEKAGATLKAAPITLEGEVDLEAFANLINDKTRFVSINHVSNALGTINPVKQMVDLAKNANIPVLIDGAQAAPHIEVDVRILGCDFYALSGHKMYGPTGIGLLWGKAEHLEAMQPYQGGGDMISYVTIEKSQYAPIPNKFEAGTPNIAGAIGMAAAARYVYDLGFEAISQQEHELLTYATECFNALPSYKIIGTAQNKSAVISFVHETIHPHDMGTILDSEGIAVRSGHHCAMPVMDFFDVPATTRASFSFYNTRHEIDVLMQGLQKVESILG